MKSLKGQRDPWCEEVSLGGAIVRNKLEVLGLADTKLIVPPIKIQGIKTKIVPLIREVVDWDGNGVWVEPFLGSGVVAFNMAPERAILADKNRYIIAFYKGIQDGTITSSVVREFLEYHGACLSRGGKDYYLEMRRNFNKTGDLLSFLFLNRSDFNGMIRFNKSGGFNVPFCQKPDRFAKAYITKICNQIDRVAAVIDGKQWSFEVANWQDTLAKASRGDYVYLDPPYIGRDTSYVGEWPESEARELARMAHETPARVCLSMWKENRFRRNDHLYDYWSDFLWHEQQHFYHFGGRESNRHAMTEVLATSPVA